MWTNQRNNVKCSTEMRFLVLFMTRNTSYGDTVLRFLNSFELLVNCIARNAGC